MTYDGIMVGENIRNLRLSNKMSLEEVAFEVHKSESHLSQIEQGNRGLSIQLLYSLMSLFRVDANAILGVETKNNDNSLDKALEELPSEKQEIVRNMIVGMLKTVPSM